MFEENNKEVGFSDKKTEKKLDSFEKINQEIQKLNYVMYAVVLVVIVGFVGILGSYLAVLSDSVNRKEDMYYQLLEKVNQNNCGFY